MQEMGLHVLASDLKKICTTICIKEGAKQRKQENK